MSLGFRSPAGLYRHRIIIEKPIETRDSQGGVIKSFSTLATVWAEVKPLNSKESIQGGQVDNRTTHFIKMRQQSVTTLDTTMRIKFGSRLFNLIGVRNIDERDKVLICDAVEDTT